MGSRHDARAGIVHHGRHRANRDGAGRLSGLPLPVLTGMRMRMRMRIRIRIRMRMRMRTSALRRELFAP